MASTVIEPYLPNNPLRTCTRLQHEHGLPAPEDGAYAPAPQVCSQCSLLLKKRPKRNLRYSTRNPFLYSRSTTLSSGGSSQPPNWRNRPHNHRVPTTCTHRLQGSPCHAPCSTTPSSRPTSLPPSWQNHPRNCMGRRERGRGRRRWRASDGLRRAPNPNLDTAIRGLPLRPQIFCTAIVQVRASRKEPEQQGEQQQQAQTRPGNDDASEVPPAGEVAAIAHVLVSRLLNVVSLAHAHVGQVSCACTAASDTTGSAILALCNAARVACRATSNSKTSPGTGHHRTSSTIAIAGTVTTTDHRACEEHSRRGGLAVARGPAG